MFDINTSSSGNRVVDAVGGEVGEDRPHLAWVVESDAGIRELLRAVLADEGFEVEVFSASSDAVSVAVARSATGAPPRPTVLVVDTFRAEVAALAQLRRLLDQRTAVVAIEEGAMTAELREALHPTAILGFSFDLEELLEALDRGCGRFSPERRGSAAAA
jgi:DNA-binding NtrC family response regulator